MSFHFIIRADASSEMGTGHVMRCLALAQSLQNNNIKPIFICANLPAQLATRLTSENFEFIIINEDLSNNNDAQISINIAQKYQAHWIIVDGYQFNSQYQKHLKEAGLKVLFFDDYGHCNYYYADLILNQNLGADENLYLNRENYTQLLLGNDYTLLRKEFLQWQKYERQIKPIATKILVTLGGSDPDNVTLKVIQALSLIFDSPQFLLEKEAFQIIIIIGGSNPYFQELKSYLQILDLNIILKQNVTNMPELIAWADLAIAAGGSTNWELAFMGLPSIIITIADNQREIAKNLHDMGLTVNLGWHEDVTVEMIKMAIAKIIKTPEQRYQMSKKGKNLIDGYGSSRILAEMKF